jgi:hypothetical protein
MFSFQMRKPGRISLDRYGVGRFAIILVLACVARAEAQIFFEQSIDRQWEVIQKQCTLIEGVPLIGKTGDLSPQAVALSVQMSYHERELPILGPGRPKRVERLVAQGRFHGESLTKEDSSLLESALYRSEDASYREFLKYARLHPTFTEGQVRAAALQETVTLHPTQTFRNLAEARGQTVKIDQAPPRFSIIKDAVDHKLIGVLAFDHDSTLYPVVGYVGDSQAVVIDPEGAKPLYRPATEALLTESDRKSQGEFARKSREYLQRITVPVDVRTSCRGPRPPGLTLVNLQKLPPSRFYVITEWTVDIPHTIMKFHGAEDAPANR